MQLNCFTFLAAEPKDKVGSPVVVLGGLTSEGAVSDVEMISLDGKNTTGTCSEIESYPFKVSAHSAVVYKVTGSNQSFIL